MHAQPYRPIEAPCAWTGAGMQLSSEWLRPFARGELEEINTRTPRGIHAKVEAHEML